MVIHTVREDQFLSMQVVLGITQTIFWPDILVVATVVKVIVEAMQTVKEMIGAPELNGTVLKVMTRSTSARTPIRKIAVV